MRKKRIPNLAAVIILVFISSFSFYLILNYDNLRFIGFAINDFNSKDNVIGFFEFFSLLGILNIFGIILVIIIFIAIIIALIKLNEIESEKIKFENEKFKKYNKLLNSIYPEISNLDSFNKLVRNFFKEMYGFNYNLTYLELANEFKKKEKQNIEKFCISMSNFTYSGKKLTNEDFVILIKLFSNLLSEFN